MLDHCSPEVGAALPKKENQIMVNREGWVKRVYRTGRPHAHFRALRLGLRGLGPIRQEPRVDCASRHEPELQVPRTWKAPSPQCMARNAVCVPEASDPKLMLPAQKFSQSCKWQKHSHSSVRACSANPRISPHLMRQDEYHANAKRIKQPFQ